MAKRTYQPKKRRRARVHGFRSRLRTKSGRNILKRRMAKSRSRLSPQIPFENFMIAYDNQTLKLRKNTDYKTVWDKGVKEVSNNFILIYIVNKKDYSRIGISSVKNYGTAVERNKIVRRVKSILYLYNFIPGKDIVLVAKKKSKSAKYQNLKDEIKALLTKSSLINKQTD